MELQVAAQAHICQMTANGRSTHTVRQQARHANALRTWLETTGQPTDIAKLTPEVLARFFASDHARTSCRGGPKKATSLNAMRTSIRCLSAYLHDAGLVPANPARLLRRARCAPPPPKALHDDEQRRLLDVLAAADGVEAARDRALIELLLGTGIRIGSAIALDIQDVDFAHNEITLRTTKNNRPTTAILPAELATRMKAFLGTRTVGPVFLAGDHRVCMRHAQRRIAGWFAAAGVRGKSAHSCRHAFACRLLAKTGDLRLVQAALNHASIVSTTIYTQVDKARLRAVVGA